MSCTDARCLFWCDGAHCDIGNRYVEVAMVGNHNLRRRIFWWLAIKLLALVAIYGFFFGPAQRVKVDDRRMETQLFSVGVKPTSGE